MRNAQNSTSRRLLTLLAVLTSVLHFTIADGYPTVRLRSGSFTAAPGHRGARGQRGRALDEREGAVPSPFFVTYDHPSQRPALKQYLQDHGVAVHGYVPDNTWLVYGTEQDVAGAEEAGLAISVVPCLGEHKVAPEWAGVTQRIDQPSATDSGDGGGGEDDASHSLTVLDETDGIRKYVITAQLFSQLPPDAVNDDEDDGALAQQLSRDWLQPLTGALQQAQLQQSAAQPGPNLASDTGTTTTDTSTSRPGPRRCRPRLRPGSGGVLLATVCPGDLTPALGWLASQPAVHWLEPSPRLARRDLAGSLVVEAGGAASPDNAMLERAVEAANAEAHPFWSRGLDGRGEVLGVSDSGVDVDSCYFFDPKMPNIRTALIPRRISLGQTQCFNSTEHRKVASYFVAAGGWFADALSHGTQVASIAAGACYPDEVSSRSASAPVGAASPGQGARNLLQQDGEDGSNTFRGRTLSVSPAGRANPTPPQSPSSPQPQPLLRSPSAAPPQPQPQPLPLPRRPSASPPRPFRPPAPPSPRRSPPSPRPRPPPRPPPRATRPPSPPPRPRPAPSHTLPPRRPPSPWSVRSPRSPPARAPPRPPPRSPRPPSTPPPPRTRPPPSAQLTPRGAGLPSPHLPSPPPSPRPPRAPPPSPRPPSPRPPRAPPPSPRPPSPRPPRAPPPSPRPPSPRKSPPHTPPPRPPPTRPPPTPRRGSSPTPLPVQPLYKVDAAIGMAPGARLAIYDFGDDRGLYSSSLNYRDLLAKQMEFGTFVESDSWGNDRTFFYNTLCVAVDRFLWLNPQLLVASAAGNDAVPGRREPNGTVSAPANAKNVLCVGSTGSLPHSSGATTAAAAAATVLELHVWAEGPSGGSSTARVAAGVGDGAGGAGGGAVFAVDETVRLQDSQDFATMRELAGQRLEAVLLEPYNACTAPAVQAAAKLAAEASSGLRKVLLASDGGCGQYIKIGNAASAGAAAVIVLGQGEGSMAPRLSYNPGNFRLPAAALGGSLGAQLVAALAAGGRVFVQAAVVAKRAYDDVPSFSAYGPTVDRRIKPDVVAPGFETLSAASDFATSHASDGCARTVRSSGTSNSAPLAAGAAIIVRQYLREGYYPTGSPRQSLSTPFSPSGMLLKAILTAGAYDIAGGTSQRDLAPIQPAPSAYQGFGRVDLSASLPLAGVTPGQGGASRGRGAGFVRSPANCPEPRLQVVDMAPIEEGDEHVYRLAATGEGPVSVSLVWVDPPADPVALVALVNDLDLQVVLARTGGSSTTYLGNGGWEQGGGRDTRNNVERVVVPGGLSGELVLTVRGTALESAYIDAWRRDTQYYALAALGCFEGVLASPYNPDPRATEDT